MYPVLFEIFGRQVGTYGVFLIIGAVAAWFHVKLLEERKNPDTHLVFLICICGGLIGAFLLRPLMKVPEIIINWDHFRQMPVGFVLSFIFGEIVFYGGLIGGTVALILFCKGFKIPMLPVADLFAPALALAHGFGRIGCFFGGCCYGITSLPIQLIEAVSLFILAGILSIVYKKTAGSGFTLCLYGLLYSVLRFILEFFRGDQIRGIYGLFSTSQYISAVIFVICVILGIILIKRRKRHAV